MYWSSQVVMSWSSLSPFQVSGSAKANQKSNLKSDLSIFDSKFHCGDGFLSEAGSPGIVGSIVVYGVLETLVTESFDQTQYREKISDSC